MRKTRIAHASLAAVLLLLALGGCRKDPIKRLQQDRETLAVVGRFAVTKADFVSALAYNRAEGTEDAWVRSRVWDGLLEEVLVLNDSALVRGEEGPPTILGSLSDPKVREAAVDAALQERVYARVTVSQEDVSAYYRDHLEEYRRGAGVLVREMWLPGPVQASDAERLLSQRHSFVDVARLYSLSPQRGAPQYFQFDELPEYLRPLLEAARPGSVTAPVRLAENSYEILLLEGRFTTYVLPEDDVAPEIRLRLSDEMGERLKDKYLQGLRERFRIIVFSSKLPFEYQKETP
jgi:hypothetical protein